MMLLMPSIDDTTNSDNSMKCNVDISAVDQLCIELEYTALSNEILKRIELRQQIVSMTLLFFGTFLGLALTSENKSLLLVYPPIAMFLAVGWSQNDFRIREIGSYIKEFVEKPIGMKWRKYFHNKNKHEFGFAIPFISIAHSGFFFFTQILSIILWISYFGYNICEMNAEIIILVTFNILSVAIVAFLTYNSLLIRIEP
jgi:hypothetical protein